MLIGDAQTNIVNTALFDLGQEPVVDLSATSLAGSVAATKLMRVIEISRDVVLARHGWTCALEYVVLQPASIANYSNYRYPSVYLLPSDALRVWEIEGDCATSTVWQAWEPRWQIGTTAADGSTRMIIRAAARVGGDGLGLGLGQCGLGYVNGQGWSSNPSAQLNYPDPLAGNVQVPNGLAPGCGVGALDVAYVRRLDWDALDTHVADAIAHGLAARGCYSITGDQGRARQLMQDAEAAVTLAIGSEATQEGGQPALAPSIPAILRAYSRF